MPRIPGTLLNGTQQIVNGETVWVPDSVAPAGAATIDYEDQRVLDGFGYTVSTAIVVVAVADPDVKALLTTLIAKTAEQTVVLQGIRARLDAGIKTQAGIISVNL